MTRAARYSANSLARRYQDKDEVQLGAMFDYEGFVQRFGKVKNFGERNSEYKTWTFWTYAKRAAEVFGPLGAPIFHQLKKYRSNVRHRVKKELLLAVSRRKKRR